MAKHVNKVILIGNVGKDPEVRYMPSGDPVAQFSMATTKSYKDQSGEKKEFTEWHNIVAHHGLATIIEQLVTKGCLIYVEGEARTRKVAANAQHPERYFHEVVAAEVSLLRDARPADSGGQDYPPPPPGRSQAPSRQPAAARGAQSTSRASPQASGQQSRPRGQQAQPSEQNFDGEDIPFHTGDAQI